MRPTGVPTEGTTGKVGGEERDEEGVRQWSVAGDGEVADMPGLGQLLAGHS